MAAKKKSAAKKKAPAKKPMPKPVLKQTDFRSTAGPSVQPTVSPIRKAMMPPGTPPSAANC